MINPLDLRSRAQLAALRHRIEKDARASRDLLTSAPDDRPATDNPIADPTADTVLHPRRIAVADARRRLESLHRAICIVERAAEFLDEHDAAIDGWHGRRSGDDD